MKADAQWDQLAGAALIVRDDLRDLAAALTEAMTAGRIPRELIVRMHDAARSHAARLQGALKHPEHEAPRRKHNRDLPCWSEAGR